MKLLDQGVYVHFMIYIYCQITHDGAAADLNFGEIKTEAPVYHVYAAAANLIYPKT